MELYYTYGKRLSVSGEKFLRCQTPHISEDAVRRFKLLFGDEKVENMALCGSMTIRVNETGDRAILVAAENVEMAKAAIEARYIGRHTVDWPNRD